MDHTQLNLALDLFRLEHFPTNHMICKLAFLNKYHFDPGDYCYSVCNHFEGMKFEEQLLVLECFQSLP